MILFSSDLINLSSSLDGCLHKVFQSFSNRPKISMEDLSKDIEELKTNFVKFIDFQKAKLGVIKEKLDKKTSTIMVHEAQSQLAAVHSIPSLYRMTGAGAPNCPSEYVRAILQPFENLVNFLCNNLDTNLDLVEDLMTRALEEFQKLYADEVKMVIKKIENDAKSLRRSDFFQRNIKASNAPLSDETKMYMQLLIDVEHYLSHNLVLNEDNHNQYLRAVRDQLAMHVSGV
eukprot:GHVP01019082.1.p2 GENE.GHVP01019082.1~~GHVP01019082.1.p2  ORF type:complete len:230 (+),score=44.87 GHVP01019082.1:1614-2303(+)